MISGITFTHRNFLKILVSFVIAAFGLPSLSSVLSIAAASFAYALFWSGALALQRRRFLLAAVWFAGVQAIQLNWMISTEYMGPGIIAVYLLVILGLGLQFGCLTSCIRFPIGWIQIAGLSGFWVLMEWSRIFFLTGFPWNPIGLTLAANSYAIQSASLCGVYGLCFWVIFVNLLLLRRSFRPIWLLCACLPYGYGMIHEYIVKKWLVPGEELSVALVQTALRPEQRDFFPAKAEQYIHPLMQWDLILSHLQNSPDTLDLIVFSEGAVPYGPSQPIYTPGAVKTIWQRHFGEEALEDFRSIRRGKKMNNSGWIQALSNHFQAQVVVGLDERSESKIYNSAFHFVPEKEGMDRYQKQILIPMGEYIPFGRWKWLVDIAAETFGIQDSFSPGAEMKIFSGPLPLGVFICLEEAYSGFIRNIRHKGAGLLVNLTNDVWFPGTRFPWHHFDHGRLRAAENGVWLLRATNTGITSVIDCYGKAVAVLPPSEKEGGVLYFRAPMPSYSTLYTMLGDVPILIVSAVFLVFFVVYSNLPKKKLL